MAKTSFDQALQAVARLRNLLAQKPGHDVKDVDQYLADYSAAIEGYDHEDVSKACAEAIVEETFMPTPSQLLARILKHCDRRVAKLRAGPRPGENFVERCLRLGYPATVLSKIGVQQWLPVCDHATTDRAICDALDWCLAHPGERWRPRSLGYRPSPDQGLHHP